MTCGDAARRDGSTLAEDLEGATHMVDAFDEEALRKFHEAVQTMKRYRRADIENEKGESLVRRLYVDPLPREHVLNLAIKENTTFLIGRKGSGKSTILQALQHELDQDRRVASAYIDIKTVFESSQVDHEVLRKAIEQSTASSAASVQEVLLMRTFLREIIKEDYAKPGKAQQDKLFLK
jgi:ABC-type transport system involved in cytochrome bd biosynthesis fused ATPase/permease subunit